MGVQTYELSLCQSLMDLMLLANCFRNAEHKELQDQLVLLGIFFP